MKFFLCSILLLTHQAWADCQKDPAADYAKEFEADSKEVILSFSQDLSGKGFLLHLLAAKSSCGAKSCEYAGYIKDVQNCFHRVLSFTGSFELGKPEGNGLKNLVVHEPQENGQRLSCEWVYRPELRQMHKLPATCKFQK